MRLAFGSVALFLVAACDGGTVPASPDGPLHSEQTTANGAVSGASPEDGQSMDGDSGLRFVGEWAANEGSCESAAWTFTDTMLSTPAGSTCSFNKAIEVPGGYDIEATCTAEGPPMSDLLKVRFGDSESMVFESDTIADRSLVSCGGDG